jgi:hypothetical protein
MFCPDCHAAYRPGFTRCSDCEVALVDTLTEASPAPGIGDISKPELLWSGTDPRVRVEIRSALEAANVPYRERAQDVGMLPNLTQSVFAILIHARDHDAARAALEASTLRETELEGDSEELNGPESLTEDLPADDDADGEPPSDLVPDDFNPEDATAEVWSGDDPVARANLVMCLEGVGIGCATADLAGKLRLRVVPSTEKRARAIIRQITEAS